jgi:hypothetical protein
MRASPNAGCAAFFTGKSGELVVPVTNMLPLESVAIA